MSMMWEGGVSHLYGCEQLKSQMDLAHVILGGDLVGNKW